MSNAILGPLGQTGAAAALAFGFALLAAPRKGAAVAICAGQTAAAALAACGQGEQAVALVELAFAAGLAWWSRVAPDGAPATTSIGAVGAPRHAPETPVDARDDRRRGPVVPAASARPTPHRRAFTFQVSGRRGTGSVSATTRPLPAIRLAAAAALAALAGTLPGAGIAFAVVLLGMLLLVAEPSPLYLVLGLIAAQSGLVLAAIAAGLTGWGLALAVVPVLPALGIGGLWLGASRTRIAPLLGSAVARWTDTALCSLALLGACTLPWQVGLANSVTRLDARAAHMILLLAALATAASWRPPITGGIPGQSGTAMPAGRRAACPVWGSQLAILAGTVLAVLAATPLLAWPGLALATAGAAAAALPSRAEAWHRLRLGCTGLVLALCGAILLSAAPAPLAAVAAATLGAGSLALLAPELTVAAIAVILRLPAQPLLLLALGMVALLVAALGLMAPRGFASRGLTAGHEPGQHMLPLIWLAQGGVAVFSFGLGTAAGAVAGLLQITLLALSQCAVRLAQPGGLDRLAALAGLAGVPPFGVFAGLALVLEATAATTPLLLLPLSAGLAAVAWAMLTRLPAARRLCLSPAWLPLALLLLCGFAMPAPWLAWFRLAAR